MCLIGIALGAHEGAPLVVAANRDERHGRAAAAAAVWEVGGVEVLAGRDLEGGGTWLGVTAAGRFAALTNYRSPMEIARSAAGGPSRGGLVAEFLGGAEGPEAFGRRLAGRAAAFAGFNLVFGDGDSWWSYGSVGGRLARLAPGIYGLSNHLLDTPWPKVERLKGAMVHALAGPEVDLGALRVALADRGGAPDEALPDTGVGRELERFLAPPFIAGESYGTRASTIVVRDRHGRVRFEEARFGPEGRPLGVGVHHLAAPRAAR